VVIPATGPDLASDPVVYFAGGPGELTVADIPSELRDLLNLTVHRDLVFIEQRGTGQANALTCPAFPEVADNAALRASVESCLAHLPGDLRFYTTAMYADDVNQVLAGLHYAKVNRMGISYGTAVEQMFLLRHPGRVRTITMQSGCPTPSRVMSRGRETGPQRCPISAAASHTTWTCRAPCGGRSSAPFTLPCVGHRCCSRGRQPATPSALRAS
jgi:pimeloyl-ACP methyl ester carboxylesterase